MSGTSSRQRTAVKFSASNVKIVPVYAVFCEECGRTAVPQFYTDKAEANEVRKTHIATHRRPVESGS